ncbi:protein Spindly-B isoform X2 [Cloeon dipterum]|uniref:protein Spindly-B isoform X2 n=1 Tax=Cloeon dipterum TaxID=197152 RepID=UPI003220164C
MNLEVENLDENQLKSKIFEYIKALEEKTQENHALKMKLGQSDKLCIDLKEDNETCTKEIADKEGEIKALREKLKNASKPVDSSDKDDQIEALQEKLEALQLQLRNNAKELELATAANQDETLNSDLSLAKHDLSNFELVHQESCSRYEETIKGLNQELNEKTRSLCHLESTVENLKIELQTLREKFEEKEEEAIFLQNELMLYKQPVAEVEPEANKERGNSLFSEVEDNRVKALAALKNTKRGAEQAYRDLAVAKSEIQALKVQNFSLHRKWDDLVFGNTMLDQSEEKLVGKLKEKVKCLTEKLAKCEMDALKSIGDRIPKSLENHQWVKLLMEDQKKRENELESKIRSMEMSNLLAEEAVIRAKRKLNMKVAEITALEAQLGKAKLDLENCKEKEEGAAIPLPSAPALNNLAAPVASIDICQMTPVRANALNRLLGSIIAKNESMKLSEDTKEEEAQNDKPLMKPASKFIVKPTKMITSKKN